MLQFNAMRLNCLSFLPRGSQTFDLLPPGVITDT